MLELLVAASCYYGQGCAQSTANYFVVKPEVAEQLTNQGQKLLRQTNPLVIRTLTPLATLAQGRITLPLTERAVIQGQNSTISIQYTKEF